MSKEKERMKKEARGIVCLLSIQEALGLFPNIMYTQKVMSAFFNK